MSHRALVILAFVLLVTIPAHGQVDHYDVNILDPQIAATPFYISVVAKDASNATVLTASSIVTVSGPGVFDGNNDSVFTTNLADRQKAPGDGSFALQARVDTPGSYTFTVLDTDGKSGTSATINVVAGAATHFVIDTIPAQTANAAFNVTISAKNDAEQIDTAFNGTVDFSVDAGSVTPSQSSAFSNGVLVQSISVSQVGTRTLTVTHTGGTETGVSNAFTASGPLDHFALTVGSGVAGTALPISVTAQDTGGLTVASFNGTVDYSATPPSFINPSTSANFSSGVLNDSVYVTSAGSHTLTATHTGGSESGTSNSFVVSAAAMTHFSFAGVIAPQTSGVPFNVTIEARDDFQNVDTTYNGTVNFSVDNGTISPTSSGTFTSGSRTESITLSAAGLRTVTVASPSGLFTGSTTISVGSAAAARLSFNAIGTQTAGTAFPITITALDASGNTDTTFNSTVDLAVDGGSISPTTSAAFSNGTLTFNVTLTSSGLRTITATRTGGGITGSSVAFTVNAGALDHLVIDPIGTKSANQPFPITIHATDLNGNTVTSYASTATLSIDAGTITPTNTPNFTNGLLTLNVTASLAGTRTITVNGIVSGTSNAFTLDPGVLTSFRINPIATQTAGTAFSFTAAAIDASGNIVTSFNGTADMVATGAVTPPTTGAFASGQLTQSITLTKSGAQTLRLTRTGGTETGLSPVFTVNPLALTHFSIDVITTQTAGTPFPITITARDIYENAVTSFAGTVALAVDAGSINPAVSSTFASGVTTQNITLTLAGSRTITVTRSGGSESGTSNSFTLSPGSRSSYRIAPIATQNAGIPFALSITAIDANGNTVNFNGTVSFTIDAGTITPTTSTAFTSGTLTQNVAASLPGSRTLTVKTTAGTETGTATFTVLPGPANATQSSLTASPFSVAPGPSTPSTITATIRGAAGNPLSGKSVTLTQGTGSSTITPPSAVTDANGIATFSVTSTTPQTVTYTAVVTTDGVTITQTASVVFGSSTVASLALVLPSQATAGSAFIATVEARDPFGNVATGYSGNRQGVFTGAFAMPGFNPDTNGTPFGTSLNLSFSNGVARLSMILYAARTAAVAVTADTLIANANITVIAAAPRLFVFRSLPSTIAIGAPLGRGTLAVTDGYGNAVGAYDASTNPVTFDPCRNIDVGSGRGCKLDRASDFTNGSASLASMTIGGPAGTTFIRASAAGISGEGQLVLTAGSVSSITALRPCSDWKSDVEVTITGSGLSSALLQMGTRKFSPTTVTSQRATFTIPWSVAGPADADGTPVQIIDKYGNVLPVNAAANDLIFYKVAPLAATATNDGPWCAGTNVRLNGSVNYADATLSWDGPQSFHSAELSPAVGAASSLTAGTYTLHVARPFCNALNVPTSVALATNPDATIAVVGTTVADLSPGNLARVATIPGATYKWSITGGTIDSANGGPAISWTSGAGPAAKLSVDITAGGANGCSAHGSTDFTILPCSKRIAPQLLTPAAGSTIDGASARFTWTAVPGATSYQLIVASDSGYHISDVFEGTTATVDLPSGPFTWFVTARGFCAEPAASGVVAFKVNDKPGCPTTPPKILSPSPGEIVHSDLVNLSWTAVPGAIAYSVYDSSSKSLDEPLLTTTQTRMTMRVAPYFDEVFWGVVPLFPGCRGTGVNSTFRQPNCRFKPIPQTVRGFNMLSDQQRVRFEWSSPAGATQHRFRLFDGDGNPRQFSWGGFTFSGEALTGDRNALDGVSFNSSGGGAWSIESFTDDCGHVLSDRVALPARSCSNVTAPKIRGFDTSAHLPIPIATNGLRFPASEALIVLWTTPENTTNTEILMSRNDGPWVVASAIHGDPRQSTPTGIEIVAKATLRLPAGFYSVKIRSSLGNCSIESAPERVELYACERPIDAPQLIAPRPNEHVETTALTFKWYPVARASSYTLVVSGLFTIERNVPPATGKGIAWIEQKLNVPAGRYLWWVRAQTVDGCDIESAQSFFDSTDACSNFGTITAPRTLTAGTHEQVDFSISWTPSGTSNTYEVTEYELVFEATCAIGSQDPSCYYDQSGTNEGRFVLKQINKMLITGTSVKLTHGRGSYAYVVRPTDCAAQTYQLPDRIYNSASAGFRLIYVSITEPPDNDRSPYDPLVILGFHSTPYVFKHLFDSRYQNCCITSAGNAKTEATPHYTVTTSEPWLVVGPSSGEWTPDTQLTTEVDPTTLLPGTNSATVTLNVDGSAPQVETFNAEMMLGATRDPQTPATPETWIVPVVGRSTSERATYQSRLEIANVGPAPRLYEIAFHTTLDTRAPARLSFAIDPGRTVKFQDILADFEGIMAPGIGYLTIQPIAMPDESDVANSTIVGSRIDTVTPKGVFGETVHALMAGDSAGDGDVIALQGVSRSASSRTNIGIVESSGLDAGVLLTVVDLSGARLAEIPLTVRGGALTQYNDVLGANGLACGDCRIELHVQGNARVAAWASVVDSQTNDSLFVPGIVVGRTISKEFIVSGIADGGGRSWRSDVCLLNPSAAAIDAQLTYRDGAGQATTIPLHLGAGEERVLTDVLRTSFGVMQSGGALHVTTAEPQPLLITAATHVEGTRGQFIPARAIEESRGMDDPALQIIGTENTPKTETRVGLAEVSGKPVTIRLTATGPDGNELVRTVSLPAFGFAQIGDLLPAGSSYNFRIAASVIEGEGRIVGYGVLIQKGSGDPAYMPAQ